MTLTVTAYRVHHDGKYPVNVSLDHEIIAGQMVKISPHGHERTVVLVSGQHVRDFCHAVIRVAEAAGFDVPPVD